MVFDKFKNYHVLRYYIYEFQKNIFGGPGPAYLVRTFCAVVDGLPPYFKPQPLLDTLQQVGCEGRDGPMALWPYDPYGPMALWPYGPVVALCLPYCGPMSSISHQVLYTRRRRHLSVMLHQTLHYTTLNYMTLHYSTLHYTTLHYAT